MRIAILLSTALGLLATAAAAAPLDEATIRAAVERLVPGAPVERVGKAPMPGFAEVVIDGQVVYLSADGKYLFEGNLLDTVDRTNLTETSRAGLRKVVFDRIGPEQRITFAPDAAERRVTIYTDFDCGVCRRLHDQIAEYNKLGIAVEYLLYPRAGIGSASYDKAVSVWCAADRQSALTDAMRGVEPSKLQCDNPVDEQFAAGSRMKFQGTPALYAADGSYLGGYLAPAQLRVKLDQIAAAGP